MPTSAKRIGQNTGQITERRARSLANLRPPWKPGETGNAGGRPVRKPFSDALRRLGEGKPPPERVEKVRKNFSHIPVEEWTWIMLKTAELYEGKKNIEAFREAADRIEGKALQSINVRPGGSDRDLSDEELKREMEESLARLRELEAEAERGSADGERLG